MDQLITFTENGLYCAAGNFYIDPWQPVQRAIITHAHSDHARWGNQYYLCETHTRPLLQARLGPDIKIETLNYGETIFHNGVKISLHPAGHIIGSAQIRLEYEGKIWVVSGDYKLQDDGLSVPFEPVRCHTFITESTFGLPIYRWQPQELIFEKIRQWIQANRAAGKNSVLLAYSLGKAQRLIYHLQKDVNNFFVHGAIDNIHQVLQMNNWPLPPVKKINDSIPKEHYVDGVIIAPPSVAGSPWLRKLQPYALGICSGWMQVRGNARRSNADAGFPLSDHADWNGLLQAVKATGAQQVYVTHGFSSAFSRYLNEIGITSAEVKTEYGDENMPAENIVA